MDKMKPDLCIKIEDGILNIRVGAIIMKEDQFLMVENDRFDHMYSVGGRIKFGETAEEAVVREVFEETGIHVTNIKYIESQSWPFPDQLMLGFSAEYAGGEPKLQLEEII